ncbi:MAG: hypothetical protein QM496_13420 [Verrucomicrobiota bacterium]
MSPLTRIFFSAKNAGFSVLLLLAFCPRLQAQEIPADLLEDEHVREEFGVNKFTAPSIRKIFEDLDSLGDLPYEKLKRPIPATTPSDRTRLALELGGLIADGFLVVESEKLLDLEAVGRALWKRAKILGAGTRLSSHTKSLLENSALGDWKQLKEELAKTQKDVEAEMVLLRDVDAAHLISLGGWLRAFEIACVTALDPFDEKKAKILGRVDIAEYFLMSLQTLEPKIQETEHIQKLTAGMEKLKNMLDVPETKAFTKDEVEGMNTLINQLITTAGETLPKASAKTAKSAKVDKGKK